MEDEVKEINLVERIITHMLILKEVELLYIEKVYAAVEMIVS